MEEKFDKYLPALDIVAPLRARIERIYKICASLCPDKLEDIFINEYPKENGSPNYGSLFLVSPSYLMEAKKFTMQDSFDITPLRNRVYYLEMRGFDYDFERATDRSRLFVTAKFEAEIRVELTASKINCNFLKEFTFKYLKTNLVGS